MNRRNRALARARWDPAVGNFSRYMRFGPVDWRWPRRFTTTQRWWFYRRMARHMECEHDWRRQHRKPRWERGRAYQRCVRCGWTRLHPKHVTRRDGSRLLIIDDIHHPSPTVH